MAESENGGAKQAAWLAAFLAALLFIAWIAFLGSQVLVHRQGQHTADLLRQRQAVEHLPERLPQLDELPGTPIPRAR